MKIIRKLLILILLSFQSVHADNKIEFENWKNQFNFKSGNVLVSPNKFLHSKMLKMLRPLN